MKQKADKLHRYRDKRKFDITSEPEGSVPAETGRTYVVQEHHARRLHWDLRLEHDGVLLSWAVPKGPPGQIGDRNLAVHVEDHPIEYANFQGEIPAGQYGAGTVSRWDRGVWEPYGDVDTMMKEGKIEFRIDGQRLQGDFVLVRLETEKDEWLWMKMKPKHRPEPVKERLHLDQPIGKPCHLPTELAPMLCEPATAPPTSDGWLHEIKWDGYRILAWVGDEETQFKTRNGMSIRFSGLNKVVTQAFPSNSIIDGEVVVFDEKGVSRFPLLQQAIASSKTGSTVFIAFDCPFLQGNDLRSLPLTDRKEALAKACSTQSRVRLSDHHAGSGDVLLESACRAGLEGIVSKRADSSYRSARSKSWVKVRCEKPLDVWIGGFTLMSDAEDRIGALLVGDKGGDDKLHYYGRVGTGFSDRLRHSLFRKLKVLEVETSPFDPPPSPDPRAKVHWVRPNVQASIQFLDWSADGLLRQAKLLAIREPSAPEKPSKNMSKITNPGRVVDRASGLTKGEVAAYYHEIAPLILPHIANRPLSLLRCPEGVDSECFFQKHRMQGLPDSVHSIEVDEDGGKGAPYVYVDSKEGLVALVQFGVIEIHPWGSHVDDLERPDILTFDLDPADDVPWNRVVDSAFHIREVLVGLGFDPLTKVTGGKGIHVVVPVHPALEWTAAKRFCEAFAKNLAITEPKRYIAKVSKAERQGKILVDYLRNGRGATAVAAYSLRAKPTLPVAVPVQWEDLASLKPGGRSIAQVLADANSGIDAWADFEDHRRKWPG